jgi:hypothetical protein
LAGSFDQTASRWPLAETLLMAVTSFETFITSALRLERTKAQLSRTAQTADFGVLSK